MTNERSPDEYSPDEYYAHTNSHLPYIVNAHSIIKMYPDVARISTQGPNSYRSSGVYLHYKGHYHGSRRTEGNLPDKSDGGLLGFETWEDAMAKAKKLGLPSGATGWQALKGAHMNTVWFATVHEGEPFILADLEGNPLVNSYGKKFVRVTGQPCLVRGYKDWTSTVCTRPATKVVESGKHAGEFLCGVHASAAKRVHDNDVRRNAEIKAMTDKWNRDCQSQKAAEETFERIKPLLVQMGIHPDTVKIAGGAISLPAESMETVVEWAHESPLR